MATIYVIRRAILQALYDYINPQSLDTISCHDKVIMTECDIALLRREWQNLQTAGYLKAVQGYHGEYCTLAPAIRAKMDQGFSLNSDEYLYGPGAIR